MPIDYSRYPADWKAISLRIREREGWRCKWCGAVNGQPPGMSSALRHQRAYAERCQDAQEGPQATKGREQW